MRGLSTNWPVDPRACYTSAMSWVLSTVLVTVLAGPSLTEDVTFVKYHGANSLTLTDGRRLRVPGAYDEVSTWTPQQRLSLEYSFDDGLTVGTPGGPRFEVLEVFEGIHPLDAAYQHCWGAAMTTVDHHECIIAARERWDAELNRVYQILMQTLPDDSKRQLRDAQRKWIAFRDAQAASISTIVGTRDGSIHGLEAGIQIMELTRAQALRLQLLR